MLLESQRINRRRILKFTKNAALVVSVGDATTDRLWSLGILPNLSVVDGREQRFQRAIRGGEFLTSRLNLECTNPAGYITENAIRVLQAAISACAHTPVRVNVRGEEDLLVLPILMMIPIGSTIMYGQPFRGIVIVTVDSWFRKKAKDLMESLKLVWKWGYDDAVAE
jgi:uncharacterized protein (UPF0218 family)